MRNPFTEMCHTFMAIGDVFVEGFEMMFKFGYRIIKLMLKGVKAKDAAAQVDRELNWELRARRRAEDMEHDRFIAESDLFFRNVFSPDRMASQIRDDFKKNLGVELDLDELKLVLRSERMHSREQLYKLLDFLEPYYKRFQEAEERKRQSE